MNARYELVRSKETATPICVFDTKNQVRVCTFNSSNMAIESDALKVMAGLNSHAALVEALEHAANLLDHVSRHQWGGDFPSALSDVRREARAALASTNTEGR